MKNKVTQKQISQALNLSEVTVSRALRGRPDISAETKEKIVQVAKEMGFYNTPKSDRKPSRLLGAVLPMLDSFYMPIVRGMVREAENRGYLLTLAATNESEKLEKRVLKSFLELGVDGIVLSPSIETKDTKTLHRIMTKGIPIVFCDRILDQISANSVTLHYENDAFFQTKKLFESGIEKIFFLGPTDHPSSAYRRYLGYLRAFSQNKHLNLEPQCMFLENGKAPFDRIISELKNTQTRAAVVCADYKTAREFYRTIRILKLSSFFIASPWSLLLAPKNVFPMVPENILYELGERTISVLIEELLQQHEITTFKQTVLGGDSIY